MGRRKSVKVENADNLRRKPSRHDSRYDRKGSNRGGDGSDGARSRHGSEDSDGGDRAEHVSRVPSMKSLQRGASMSGSSFCRPQRAPENPPAAYRSFHLPSGEQQQLEPLPTPLEGMMPAYNNGSNFMPNYNGSPNAAFSRNGCTSNDYGGISTSSCTPPMNAGYGGAPIQDANAALPTSAPLTQRASRVHVGPEFPPQGFVASPQPLLLQQQQQQQQPGTMSYPMPSSSPNHNVNASGCQQSLLSPMRQPGQLSSVDFNRMMQSFRNLPQLPYVMAPQGPVAPPPFPFPLPDAEQIQHLQQQQQQQAMMMSHNAAAHGGMMSPQPCPVRSSMQSSYMTSTQQQSQLQPQPQQQYLHPSTHQWPVYSSQPTPMPNSSNGGPNGWGTNSSTVPVSPFTASASSAAPPASPAAPASSTTSAPLYRTTSILNRVSSFKKKVPTSSPSPTPSAALPSPKATRTGDAASPAPPQHSAAVAAAAAMAKTAAESPSTGILRRKSFFATAAAEPEPELSSEEREMVLKDKFAMREQERQRLEAEHRTREEAAQKLHQQRLRELRAGQLTEAAAETTKTGEPMLLPASAMTTTATTTPPSIAISPGATVAAAGTIEEASTSPHQNVSRASSYSFSSMTTAKSGRSGPQPPLPQPQLQSPQKQAQRAVSPAPDIGEYYYKCDTSSPSVVSNRGSSVNETPAALKSAVQTLSRDPVKEPQRQQQSSSDRQLATSPTPADPQESSGTTAAAATAAAPAPKQLWHRCPTLVLYEIPLRCRRQLNEKGEEVIDDASFPVRISQKSLRVTDAETQQVFEYPHDEFVTHRRGSTNVEAKLLDKVRDVVLAGYTAAVLSLDTKGLAKPTSAFDSAAWMAKQRLVLNVVKTVEKMQTIYSKNGCIGSSNSSIEVLVSIALVKKVSAEKAAEWKVTNPATRQRTFEVVDLLPRESAVVPLRMNTSVLFGSRLGGVEYKPVNNEADFIAAMAGAQSKANAVLGHLADAATIDPENTELAEEAASVFEVLTCIVRHRKEGAVALADQLKEAPRDVFTRGNAEEIISSDDEDDDARIFNGFNSHNGPSNCSDMVVSCLTCIGVRQNVDLWGAVLERKEEQAPSTLFSTAFGGPAYTVILASVDPTKPESSETLSMQAGMTIKLHRRPTNGSARRLIQVSKYNAGAAQKELDRPVRPSGAEQRELKTSIRKSAAILDSLEKALADDG
jgi:hypothetical protein